jgi:hypothetical protein
MADDNELIDLNKLTPRELLILVHNKVVMLEKKSEKAEDAHQEMLMKVNSLETKSKVWGSVSGFVGGILTAIIAVIIERFK